MVSAWQVKNKCRLGSGEDASSCLAENAICKIDMVSSRRGLSAEQGKSVWGVVQKPKGCCRTSGCVSAARSRWTAAESTAMDPVSLALPELASKASWSKAPDSLLYPTGVFQVAEKMEKRTCALCPKDLECSVLYFARSENIAAHENCLLYSSALVECEDHDPCNYDRSFDVEAVKKEICRGRRLKCTFCGKRGATVGCDEKACAKNYHFFCAKNDHAVLHTGSEGIYKVFCQQHAPSRETQSAHFSRVRRKRGKKKGLSTSIPVQLPEPMALNKSTKQMKEEDGRNTDPIVKAAFLKKCKDAGLLNDLFEEIVDRLHLIQERLMDETTSESDYEEIGTSLFDCRLFEDTFVNFQAALENTIHQFEEKRQQMKEEIKLLQDLKQTLCSVQENRDLRSNSTSVSSLSS